MRYHPTRPRCGISRPTLLFPARAALLTALGAICASLNRLALARLRRIHVLPGLALVAGCTTSDSARKADAAEQVPEAERYGGTAVVVLAQDLQPVNPLIADIRPNLQLHQYVLYTPVLRYDAELRPLPGLAERWDTVRVAPDTLQLTFHLRRDLRWHDGVPTTADDVRFSFERLRDPRTASPHAHRLRFYDPRVEQPDSFTVRFRVRASPDFLVAWMTLPPAPAHLLRNAAPETLHRHPFGSARPVGNGPFRFVRRVPGQEWVFEANPDYPRELGGRPRLDRLVFRIIPEATARLTEVFSGGADVAGVPFARAAEAGSAPGVRLLGFADGTWNYIGWNLRLPQFRDPRVRRALTMALDREVIAQAVAHGHARAGRSTLTPVHWAYDDGDPELRLPHDPRGARRLLEDAGWRDRDGDGIVEDSAGRPFRFVLKFPAGYDDYRESAVIAQAQLRLVGVDVVLRQMEMNTLIHQLDGRVNARGERERDFDAVLFGWTDGPFFKDDSPYLHTRSMHEPFGQAGYSNPRADRLMDSLRVTVGREAALPLWREYQRLIVEEAPYTVLFYPDVLYAVRERLQGVEMDRRGFLATAARWWIPPDARR